MFKSIRSRLALSFAGIALVAAAVLGAVLLVILQSYYSNQELDYLRGNAKFIGGFVTAMQADNAPHDEVQSQIENLAFLTQTRIQVYDENQQLLYDSGSPQNMNVNLGVMKQLFATQANGSPPTEMMRIIGINGDTGTKVPPFDLPTSPPPLTPDAKGVIIYRSVQATGSPFGFYLNAQIKLGGVRSSQVVKQALLDAPNGKVLGTVELSESPALGLDILRSVAAGWAIASAVAVLLAAGVGWYLSRRISAPILALTDVTARMAAGDLSSRAGIKSQDELGRLAHSFDQMADQVEATVLALRRFVSDAAHELHTPLTALRTNLDLAVEESDANVQRGYLERAQATVQRLEGLTNDLLDLSRIQATGETSQTIDLTELLKARTEVYASQAEQAGLTLLIDLPAQPASIRADATRVLRAVDNLVDNACKFTLSGGTVTVRLFIEDGQVGLAVADTGIGIPEQDRLQLFQRFHRGRNATAYPGSGLGLAIVKAIVEQQEGHVVAESLPVGTRFTLRWPAGRHQ
jgi:signal transduction histidine kinase